MPYSLLFITINRGNKQKASSEGSKSNVEFEEPSSPLSDDYDGFYFLESDGSIRRPSPDRPLVAKSLEEEVIVYMGRNGQAYVYDGYTVTKAEDVPKALENYFAPTMGEFGQSGDHVTDYIVGGTSNQSESLSDSHDSVHGEDRYTDPPSGSIGSNLLGDAIAVNSFSTVSGDDTDALEEEEITAVSTAEGPRELSTSSEHVLTDESSGVESEVVEVTTTLAPTQTLNREAVAYLQNLRRMGVLTQPGIRFGTGLSLRGYPLIGMPFMLQRLTAQSDDTDVDSGYYTQVDPPVIEESSVAEPSTAGGHLPPLFVMRREAFSTTMEPVHF